MNEKYWESVPTESLGNPKWALKKEYLSDSSFYEVEVKDEQMIFRPSDPSLALSLKAFEELYWLFNAWHDYWNS